MTKTIVVTGADGFIGRNLCVALRRAGLFEVLEFDVHQTERELRELLSLLARGFHIHFTARTPKLHIVKEDPDDDKFIECAVALNAEVVVTGDRALRAIQNYMGIRIVTPKDFLDAFMKPRC